MVMDIFGNNNGFPVVEAFGSFIMDLFTATSDLDLSLNFSDNDMSDFPRDKKISVLKKFSRALYAHQRRGHVSGVLPILKARVPVLKVVDCGTGIECDISVENKDGISRSVFFSLVSSIDERFRILSYLMKFWAKEHGINSSKDRTMNSLSIISLVAFHLQTRNPSILPPFSVILKDGTDISRIQNITNGLKQFGRRNRESIAELFVALLGKLSSVENLWQDGLCASTYEGSWVSKTWESGAGNMNVEDFLDRSQNLARSVGKIEMQKIYRCIRGSLGNLSCFLIGQIGASKLKALLFGSMHLNIPSDQLLYSEGMKRTRGYPFSDSGASLDPITTKKARYTDRTKEPYRYETPSALPNPSIPLLPPLPSHPKNGAYHLGPPVIPFHKGYTLEYHPQYLAVSSQLVYGSQHEQQLPFAQLDYGSQHLRPRPFQLYLGSQLHQHGQNLMDHRT
ncbi:protein HESO1 isoform X2 [Elaeis guineensis]